MLTRFGLGTAQFGQTYGRFNSIGMPSREKIGIILRTAREMGLSVVDTACQYGASERVLGLWASELMAFDVITKTPTFSGSEITKADAHNMREAFETSLCLLRLPSIGGVLVHQGSNLLLPGGERLFDELMSLKEGGLVGRIGISEYSGEIVEAIAERFSIDMVQLPINVLDRRLISAGTLGRLHARGIEIHARSAFLQGLLLTVPDRLNGVFVGVKDTIAAFQAAAAHAGIRPAQAALHYLVQIPEVARVIVGVESPAQLHDIFDDFPSDVRIDYQEFQTDDVRVLDPSQWN